MAMFRSMHKSMFRFTVTPIYSFILYLALITTLVVSSPKSGALALVIFILPWLLMVLFIFNIAFISATFRLFRMHETKKRNHAVEHATIHFLIQHYGAEARVGGKADYDGFRVSGIKDSKHIRDAFKRMTHCLTQEKRKKMIAISRACGSNVVTAQGFGIVLLTVTGAVSLLLQADTSVSLILLGLNVAVYFLLRHSLGNWIQQRFFISLDFKDVGIQSISSVPLKSFEHHHAYFVKTRFS